MTDLANELRRRACKLTYPQGKTVGVMLRAADEIERLERMEAAIRIAVKQNSHDMLMTGDELRQCESALEKSK